MEIKKSSTDSGVKPNKVFIRAICSLFSYGQLASKTIFAENFGVEYLTLVLLELSELSKDDRTGVYG